MSSSSSFRAERGRRSRDAADADNAPAHSICGKMKSFLFSCVVIYVRERESNVIRKTAFFSLFFIPPCGTVSQFPSRNREKLKTGREETHPTYAFKKNCRNTRVDSHSHTHALKTFTSSRPRKKKRERGTFHSRAFFSFKARSRFLL
jgi:hypothetical protein